MTQEENEIRPFQAAKIPPQFIQKRQGKEFVSYEGLLAMAHAEGLRETDTILLQAPTAENEQTAIFKAVVVTERGRFSAHGDANPTNVNKMIAMHLIRMAETRALARAFRQATNVGMAAVEELGDGKVIRQGDVAEVAAQLAELSGGQKTAQDLINWARGRAGEDLADIYEELQHALLAKLKQAQGGAA